MLKRYVITFNHVINYEVVGTKTSEIPALIQVAADVGGFNMFRAKEKKALK